MYKKPYESLLKKMPDPASDDFITFLRMNNKVEYEDDIWIVIKNYKYDRPKHPWLTAFLKRESDIWYMYIPRLWDIYGDWQWVKKAFHKQTIKKRFHIHLIEKPHEPVDTTDSEPSQQKVPILQKKEVALAGKATHSSGRDG